MATTDLRRRLMWLITVRLVVSTTLLGWAMLMQVSSPGVEIQSFYLLIALTYGLSFVFGATVRFVARHPWLIDAQLACDALIISLFIAFTGGINSYFSSLYFLPIIAAGSLQLRRGAVMVALLSALVYVGVTVLQYQDASVGPAWPSTRWSSTCSPSSPWRTWPVRSPIASRRPARGSSWPRRRSRTCRRSTSTSSTA
jgi:hypothetical protein